MQERKASWRRWTVTRLRRNYPTRFDQQEEENMKFFITNLKIIWFLTGFTYAVDFIAATHQMP